MGTSSARRWLLGGSVAAMVAVGSGVAVASGGSSRGAGPDYLYGASAFTNASAAVHVVNTGLLPLRVGDTRLTPGQDAVIHA